MQTGGFSPQFLSTIAAILLSLAFSYVPGLRAAFERLDPTRKRLVMLGLIVLGTAGVFGLACLRAGSISGIVCSQEGAWSLLEAFILAVMANQSTFLITPRARPNRKVS